MSDPDSEYYIRLRKHFTEEYLILEFDTKSNTDCDI